MPTKKKLEDVLAEFHEVHGDFYDYSSVEYINSSIKVKVCCPLHGDFEITPAHHKKGVGCSKCFFDSQKTSKEKFVSCAKAYFKDRYDYSLFDALPKLGEKVPIFCREHNEVFLQEPRNHRRGHTGCSKCKANKLLGPRNKIGGFKSDEELKQNFIGRARGTHGSVYDYSEFRYLGSGVEGKIICPIHGEFWQTPTNHLKGMKCPDCVYKKKKANTFKGKCSDLGVDYWRALKRREAGLSEEKIFEEGYVRNSRETNQIVVFGVKYPNLEEAMRALNPHASSRTISRWIKKGMPPEKAFESIPNPGYANGIIYLITHRASGRKYVGLTVQILDRRWRDHIEQAFAGYIKGSESLHAAIREFGPDAFDIQQIDHGTTKQDLEKKERYWIKMLGTLVPNGYNISRGGVSGGSSGKPMVVDGIRFDSVKKAAQHLAETREISLDAAKGRLRHNRIDAKTPAKPGESLVKTPVYKTWSRIVHGVLNPNSREYIPGIELHGPWFDFKIFYRDVGHPPTTEMAFARLDKSKGFYPGNCAWLSKSEASKINASYMKEKGTLVGRKGRANENSQNQACLRIR